MKTLLEIHITQDQEQDNINQAARHDWVFRRELGCCDHCYIHTQILRISTTGEDKLEIEIDAECPDCEKAGDGQFEVEETRTIEVNSRIRICFACLDFLKQVGDTPAPPPAPKKKSFWDAVRT